MQKPTEPAIDPWRSWSTENLASDAPVLSAVTDSIKDLTLSTLLPGNDDWPKDIDALKAHLSKLLIRSVCSGNGDSNAMVVQRLLEEGRKRLGTEEAMRPLVDTCDEQGSTALVYAACFGQREVCYQLLKAGASVDISDKHGWTPLVWATNNGHDQVARLLMEWGASSTSTATMPSGMTVGDFISHTVDPASRVAAVLVGSADIFRDGAASQLSQTRSLFSDDDGGFYKAGSDMLGIDQALYQSIGVSLQAPASSLQTEQNINDDDDGNDDGGDDMLNKPFNFDECLPDQMFALKRFSFVLTVRFVFDPTQTEALLETVIHAPLPHLTRSTASAKLAPAHVLFLAARYAFHFGGDELLGSLLAGSISRLGPLLQKWPEDMALHAFWLSNASHLLAYLQRDSSLSGAMALWQVKWTEFIQTTFNALVKDVIRRLRRIAIPALCAFESIPGGNQISWRRARTARRMSWSWIPEMRRSNSSDDVRPRSSSGQRSLLSMISSRFQWRSSDPNVSSKSADGARGPNLSPRSVTTLLASVLFVMQCYVVPVGYQSQALDQIILALSADLMNAMLLRSDLCSRWKGMQIRMNVSVLEDWIRNYTARTEYGEIAPQNAAKLDDLVCPLSDMPADDVLSWLRPVIAACQLLQTATTTFADQEDGDSPVQVTNSFMETLHSFGDMAQKRTRHVADPYADLDALEQVSISVSSIDTSTAIMTFPQLYSLLVQNYTYEKDEPKLHRFVEAFLQDKVDVLRQRIEKKHRDAPQQPSSADSRSWENESFRDGDIQKHASASSLEDASLMREAELWKDAEFTLPFRLCHFAPLGDTRTMQPRVGHWWNQRVKIEIPEWVLSQIK